MVSDETLKRAARALTVTSPTWATYAASSALRPAGRRVSRSSSGDACMTMLISSTSRVLETDRNGILRHKTEKCRPKTQKFGAHGRIRSLTVRLWRAYARINAQKDAQTCTRTSRNRRMETHEQSGSSPTGGAQPAGGRPDDRPRRRMRWRGSRRGSRHQRERWRGDPGVCPVVGAGAAGQRHARADGRVRVRQPRREGQAAERPVRLHQGAGLRRRGGGHHVRRGRTGRGLGQRLRQAGRHRRPVGHDGRGQLRPEPARQPGQGRRQDLHDPGGQLRLPDVHQPGPAEGGRRRQGAEQRAPSSPPPRRRSARPATTTAAGSCPSLWRLPTASRTTSCRGCGPPAAPCWPTGSPP